MTKQGNNAFDLSRTNSLTIATKGHDSLSPINNEEHATINMEANI